jgi:hypothetical protein
VRQRGQCQSRWGHDDHSDDGDVAALAKAAKLEVARLADLLLPPEDAQLKLDQAGDEIGDQDTTTETAS